MTRTPPRPRRLRPVWFFFARYAWIYSVLAVLLVLSAALEAVNVGALFPFVGAVLDTGGAEHSGRVLGALSAVVRIIPVRDRVVAASIVLAAIILLKGVVALTLDGLVAYGSGTVVYETKQRIFRRYAQAPYRFFVEQRQGDLTYRVATAPQSLGLVLLLIPYSLTQLLTIVFIIGLLATIDWRFTVGIGLIGAVFYGLVRVLSRRVSYIAGRGRAKAMAAELGLVTEFFTGVKEIVAYLAAGYWLRRHDAESREFRRLYIKDTIWQSIPSTLLEVVTLGLVGGVVLTYRLAVGQAITSGLPALAVYAYAIHRLIAAVSQLSRYWLRTGGLVPDVELLHATLQTDVPSAADGDRSHVSFTRTIAFQGVSLAYPLRSEAAVRDITFTIPKGRVTAIVGPSGSGKTTLVNLLLRFYDPTGGAIFVDDTNLAHCRRDAWLSLVGYVGQETFIFNGTVVENIRFGWTGPDEAVVDAAVAARADEFIDRLPHGYKTVVGDRGMTLSGGQRQRLAIARALLRRPQLLIFDEATSALDTHSEALIQQAIAEMSQTHTVLIIAHRLSTIAPADQIVVLSEGRVVEVGTHRELLLRGGPYARIAASG